MVKLWKGKAWKADAAPAGVDWDRLLEDAQSDPYYHSWLSKIQAALQHCCGRALRKELQLETRLTSQLIQLAQKIRTAEKTRRKVGNGLFFFFFLPHESVRYQSCIY